jgi:hypothetical protein
MRQQRWVELIKHYELEVHYHSGKANVVADALSRKAHCNYLPIVHLAGEESSTWVLLGMSLYNVTLTPLLQDEIIEVQKDDKWVAHLKRRLAEGDPQLSCFHEDAEGTLWFNDWIIVPKKDELRKKILDDAHATKYSIHPSSTKMYQDLRAQFRWMRMKRATARYMSECDTCRKVKADYMKPEGLL